MHSYFEKMMPNCFSYKQLLLPAMYECLFLYTHIVYILKRLDLYWSVRWKETFTVLIYASSERGQGYPHILRAVFTLFFILWSCLFHLSILLDYKSSYWFVVMLYAIRKLAIFLVKRFLKLQILWQIPMFILEKLIVRSSEGSQLLISST